jgi:hypothetical protein
MHINLLCVFVGIGTLVVAVKASNIDRDMRRQQIALSTLSLLLAALDWIPYITYTWQRQQTILSRWAVPASGAASVIVNTVWVLVTMTDLPRIKENRAQGYMMLSLMALGTAIFGAIFMNLYWLYFVHYEPIKRPARYEPVVKVVELDNESPDLPEESTQGPLARLYEVQKGTISVSSETRAVEAEIIVNQITVSKLP